MTTPPADYTPTHEVILDAVDGNPRPTRLVCNAGPEGLCHAVWTCDCDETYDAQIRNGVPAHRPDLEDEHTWHAGRFNPEMCILQDWFDNLDECVFGEIRVPVREVWHGGYVTFTMLDTTATTIRQAKAEALREAAAEVYPRAATWLRARASRIEAGE